MDTKFDIVRRLGASHDTGGMVGLVFEPGTAKDTAQSEELLPFSL